MVRVAVRLGLRLLAMCAGLVGLAVGFGLLAQGDVIAFDTVLPYSETPRNIYLVDVNTRLLRWMGFKDFWFNDSLVESSDDLHPIWSPDGRRIAFLRYTYNPSMDIQPQGSYVCVMNADGTDPHCLAEGQEPTWVSLDGTMIAFISNGGLYVMNVDTGETINPTNYEPDAYIPSWQHNPTWSPQSNLIAFTWGDISGDIYVVEPNGENLQSLTEDENTFFPTWSPDGQKIAFRSRREETTQLYVMNVDGTDAHPITEGPSEVHYAAWSPDGTQIAVAVHSPNAAWGEISVVNTDGTNRRWLAEGSSPSWSPDGSQIAFVSPQDNTWQIYIINSDGSGLFRLTNSGAHVDDYPPAWRP